MNEKMTGKCGISGGNLSTNFKVNYILEIDNDLTREQELDEMFASLRIKHQKCRDNTPEAVLTERQTAGKFTVKASSLLEKKVKVALTPEQNVNAIIATNDKAVIEKAIRDLQELMAKNAKK